MKRPLSALMVACFIVMDVGCGKHTRGPTTAPPLKASLAAAPGLEVQSVDPVVSIDWARQFGTPSNDRALGLSVDADGNAYVTGFTDASLPGQSSAGGYDVYLRKYDATGTEVWTRQFGTASNDQAWQVSVDASGNAYVAGFTEGTFAGQTSAGGTDAFVRKYDAGGTELWTRQLGTSNADYAYGVSVDASGNGYLTGYTNGTMPGQSSAGGYDAFVWKFGAGGNAVWTRQFGTSTNEQAFGVAVDAGGNACVVGYTAGTFPGQTSAGATDAFVRKYDAGGNALWTRQFGTSFLDQAIGVAVDAGGNAYVTGVTNDTLPGQTSAGGTDAFVRKYDAGGTEVWTRQFGDLSNDQAWGVAVDLGGSAYVAGYTEGALPGQISAGSADAFVRKYDAGGNAVWTRQFGTPSIDHAYGVSVDAGGKAYVTGNTNGTLPGQSSAGSYDGFVSRLTANQSPTIACPADIAVEATGPGGAAVTYGLTASDPDGQSVTVSASPPSGSIFPLGSATVSVTAVDSSGATATCSFSVLVRDTTPPVLSKLSDLVLSTDNPNGISVHLPDHRVISAADLVDAFPALAFLSAPAVFPIGSTPVTVKATDFSGNSSTRRFNLTVQLVAPIDVKPGSDPASRHANPINLGSNGVTPYAILSTSLFDATRVNPSTVTLAGAPVVTRKNGAPHVDLQDVNDDGLLDMVLQSRTTLLQLTTSSTEAIVKGALLNGLPFRGSDAVVIVKGP